MSSLVSDNEITLTGEEGHLVIIGFRDEPLHHTLDVTVAKAGCIHGSVSARRIVVEGRVTGKLHAEISIEVRGGAEVQGDMAAPRISVNTGARIKGCVSTASSPRSGASLNDAEVHRVLEGIGPEGAAAFVYAMAE